MAVALTALALLVALNLGLNLGISRPIFARLVSKDPQSFNLDYRVAWTLWPALVHVRDLQLRGSDSNLQWAIEIERARASIDLVAIFKRQFHATNVRADGIAVRVRQRIDLSAATAERVASLPPILGFSGPPLIEEGPPLGEVSDKEYDLWSVQIENVDGHAKQLWIDEFDFEGDVHVVGSFALKPKRSLWVGPANATITSGSVKVGRERILGQLAGQITCTIPPFNPVPVTGYEAFRFVSGAIRLDARILSAKALDYYARIRGSSARMTGGSGTLHLVGGLRSGVISPLTLSLAMNDLRAQRNDWIALGSVQLSNSTAEEGPSVSLLQVSHAELHQIGVEAAAFTSAELSVRASTKEIDLSKPLPGFIIRGDAPSAELPDLQFANALLLSKNQLRIERGSASLSATFEAATHTNIASGTVALSTDRVVGRNGKLRFAGRFSLNAAVTELLLASGNLDATAVIHAREVSLRDSDTTVSDWWSNMELKKVRVRPSNLVPFDVSFQAKLSSATPVLAFSKRTPDIPGWITRFFTSGEVNTSGRLRGGTKFLELSNFKATTGILKVTGKLQTRGEATFGAFQVSSGPLSVGIELNNDETKLIFVSTNVAPTPASPSLK